MSLGQMHSSLLNNWAKLGGITEKVEIAITAFGYHIGMGEIMCPNIAGMEKIISTNRGDYCHKKRCFGVNCLLLMFKGVNCTSPKLLLGDFWWGVGEFLYF